MSVTFPALTAGQLILPNELNTNFADCIDATRGLTTANLAARAGVVSSQLADRYSIWHVRMQYLPRIGTTGSAANLVDLSTGVGQWTTPNATVDPGVELDRVRIRLRDGKAAFLCSCVIRAQVIGGTGLPRFWLTKNGVVLGGGPFDIAASATDYEIGNSSAPFDSPICPLQHTDYLTIGLGRSANTPTLWGLCVDLWGKIELGA